MTAAGESGLFRRACPWRPVGLGDKTLVFTLFKDEERKLGGSSGEPQRRRAVRDSRHKGPPRSGTANVSEALRRRQPLNLCQSAGSTARGPGSEKEALLPLSTETCP